MANLIPLTRQRAASTGFRQGDANPARFAAIDYVNKLVIAPDGSRITSTEKNVLKSLAQWYNAELGVAWPCMRELAQRCSISERHCRRTIARLERKGVIARVYNRRRDQGSQTSNEYFFPTLGVPPETEQKQQARLQLQRVPRTRMAAGVGQTRPRPVATYVPEPRTDASAGPGHPRPPIESLIETLTDSLKEADARIPRALAAVQGKVQIVDIKTLVPNKTKNVLNNLDIARPAWESALQKVRAVNGAKEFRSHSFQDVRISAARSNSDASVTLELRSPNPEKTICGILRFQEIIARALRRYYGCEVKLECLGEAAEAI
jgi:Helix-turn-helix domain